MNPNYAIPATLQTESKEEILNDLFHRYHRKLVHTCYGYTRDWDDAKEMAQEAFLRAYQALDGFEGRCQLLTWITRIAINLCLSHLASRGRERLGMLNYVHERDREAHEEKQEEQSSKVDMAKLLQSADETTRKVLELAFGQGLTHSQISMTLGVCRVAVTRRITRFKRKVLRLEAALA